MKPNADITLYHYSDDKYTRQIIKGAYWFDVKQSNVIKSGLVNADSVSIHIPVTSVDNLEITTSKDLVINGIVDMEIDNSSQQTQSASLKALNQAYDVFTITVFDPKLYGSRRLQHYELSCK
jgi:hypothetical protein